MARSVYTTAAEGEIASLRTAPVLLGVPIFVILNAPSVKLLYSTEWVNVVALAGLAYVSVLVALAGERPALNKAIVSALTLNALLWAFIYMSVVWGTHSTVDATLFVRYAGAFLSITLIGLVATPDSMRLVGWLQVVWGTALGVMYLRGQITLDARIGQHYLTLGVPLAAGLIASLGFAVLLRGKVLIRIGLLGNAVLCLLVLAALLGRSPILLSAMVLTVAGLVFASTAKAAMTRILSIFGFAVISVSAYLLSRSLLQDVWLERITRLVFNVEAEPRYKVYIASIELLERQPFGYGMGSSDDLIGFYPHNLFLEIVLSAGLLAAVPVLLFCGIVASKTYELIKLRSSLAVCAMVAIYLFLTWNVSFDLGSAYVPLGYCMAVIAASTRVRAL